MKEHIHRLHVKLEFPEGISAGEESNGNHLILARDGQEHPVLRGTSLAGALRHAWSARHGVAHDSVEVADWFGSALDGEETRNPSCLRVQDMKIDLGKGSEILRTHIAIDRHRGSVVNGGLYSLEALPPGCSCEQTFYLAVEKIDAAEAKQFFEEILGFLDGGVSLGGSSARGIGRVVAKDASYRCYDLGELVDKAAYLDENRLRREGRISEWTGEDLMPNRESETALILDLTLGVPGAEDLLLGDGQGLDFQIEPQTVKKADGKDYWRIPGSSLRGVFRGWITRLAARAGHPVADSLPRYQESGAAKGDELGWGFVAKEERERIQEDPDALTCPIMKLFGSLYAKSRIHISDAYSEEPADKQKELQHRMHVAIDRITGGANEGFLFDNGVLTSGPRFHTRIQIEDPSEEEAQWVYSTLVALDLGVLRVGSSKAGGILRIQKLDASGLFAHQFSTMSLDMKEENHNA